MQGSLTSLLQGLLPGSTPAIIENAIGKIGNNVLDRNQDEDCLFLDVYVPGKIVKSLSTSKLPIVVSIYGGGYIIGSKDLFGCKGIVKASGNNVIAVAGNYRLGHYGFLAGTTVENEGVPNAGFWDQRAVLQWTQKYSHLVGGDKTNIVCWGESAGGGSILHQLTAFGGKQDPLFHKAVIMSPAYFPIWDRKTKTENNYKDFEKYAGCEGKGLACLRQKSTKEIDAAGTKKSDTTIPGTFAASVPRRFNAKIAL